MRRGAALAALWLAASPALAQPLPALDDARFAYETCAEIAIGDEYLGEQFQHDHNFRAAAERALATCQTEESAFFSKTSAILASMGNAQNMAAISARAQVDHFKVALKLRLVNHIMDMTAGRR